MLLSVTFALWKVETVLETIHGAGHLGSDLQISAAGRNQSLCNVFHGTPPQTVRKVFQPPISPSLESPLLLVAVPLPPLKIAASEILFLNSAVSYSLGGAFSLRLCLSDLGGIHIHTRDLDVHIFPFFELVVFSLSESTSGHLPSRTSHNSLHLHYTLLTFSNWNTLRQLSSQAIFCSIL